MNKFWQWMMGIVLSATAVGVGALAFFPGLNPFKSAEPDAPAPGEEVAPLDGVEVTDELAQHLLNGCGVSSSLDDARKQLNEKPEVLSAVSASFNNSPFDPFSTHWQDVDNATRDMLASEISGIGEVCRKVSQIDQIQADMVSILELVAPTLAAAENRVKENLESGIDDFVTIGDAQVGMAQQARNLDISQFGDTSSSVDLYPLFTADDKSFFEEDLLQFYDAIAFGFLGKTRHSGFQSVDEINQFLENNSGQIDEILAIFGSSRDSYTFAYEPFVPLLRPFLQPDQHPDSPLHAVGIGR